MVTKYVDLTKNNLYVCTELASSEDGLTLKGLVARPACNVRARPYYTRPHLISSAVSHLSQLGASQALRPSAHRYRKEKQLMTFIMVMTRISMKAIKIQNGNGVESKITSWKD